MPLITKKEILIQNDVTSTITSVVDATDDLEFFKLLNYNVMYHT